LSNIQAARPARAPSRKHQAQNGSRLLRNSEAVWSEAT
jgi:hypothetical protein